MTVIDVGMRVHHVCDWPDCPIYGRVVDVQLLNIRTNDEAAHGDPVWSRPWALVEFDPTTGAGDKDIPPGYKQWLPCEKLEPVPT